MTLRDCRFRLPSIDVHDRPCFACSHPLVRGGQLFAAVYEANCRECVYVGFDGIALRRDYRQQHDLQPTEEEHADRVDACEPCESRIDNYCPLAGGNCNLVQKLTKGSFSCPAGKFGEIARDR